MHKAEGEREPFAELTDSIMDDFSIPERCSFPAFRVPSASERGDESGFMGLQSAGEANLCEWLLKSNITWPDPFNKLKAILHPQCRLHNCVIL